MTIRMNNAPIDYMQLTVAEISAMTDEELEALEQNADVYLSYNHSQLSPYKLYRIKSVSHLCYTIRTQRKIKLDWETKYPELTTKIETWKFPEQDQLAGLDDLCAQHGLHVHKGSGWGLNYKGVYVTVDSDTPLYHLKSTTRGGPTLRDDFPDFMAAVDQINAEWESRHAS